MFEYQDRDGFRPASLRQDGGETAAFIIQRIQGFTCRYHNTGGCTQFRRRRSGKLHTLLPSGVVFHVVSVGPSETETIAHRQQKKGPPLQGGPPKLNRLNQLNEPRFRRTRVPRPNSNVPSSITLAGSGTEVASPGRLAVSTAGRPQHSS